MGGNKAENVSHSGEGKENVLQCREIRCNSPFSLPCCFFRNHFPLSLLALSWRSEWDTFLHYCSYPDTLIAAKLLGVDLIYFMLMTFKTLQSIFTEIVIFPRYALYKYFSILQCLGPPCSPVCGGGGMDDGRVWATKLAATD